MKDVLKKFDDLGREVLDKCEQIECSIPEFIEGLTTVLVHLESARDAAVEAHKAVEKDKT